MDTVVVKNYFDEMLKDVYLNELSVEKFYKYYSQLKKSLSKKIVSNSLEYIIGLKKSKIENPDTVDEELLIYNCKKDLDNLLKESVEDVLKDDKIDLIEYFEQMKININDNIVLLDDYYNYNEMISLAIILDDDKIDVLEYAGLLYDAQVEYRKSYNEEIRYNTYQEKLSEYIKNMRSKVKIKRQ